MIAKGNPASPSLRLVSSRQSAPVARQMSHPREFGPLGGRGRDGRAARRVEVAPVLHRGGFLVFWSGLMLRRCGGAHEIAMRFDVTEQTGRNWIDAVACPSGWMVFQAQQLWPEEFAGGGV
jgi:hypothetical protein